MRQIAPIALLITTAVKDADHVLQGIASPDDIVELADRTEAGRIG
jgi:hypothetical protein